MTLGPQTSLDPQELKRREERTCLDFDLMIAGAQKSGTSTLLTHLLCGTDVAPLYRPEIAYFTDDQEFKRGAQAVERKYFGSRPLPLSLRIGKDISLLGTPSAIPRLLADSPRVQLIVVLREPVARAYSSYWFARRRGFEPEKSFAKAIERELTGRKLDLPRQDLRNYVSAGEYAFHIKRLFEHVEPHRVRVLLLEDVHENPIQVANDILAEFGRAIPDGVSLPFRTNASARARSESLARFFGSSQLRRMVRPLLPPVMRGSIERVIRRLNDVPFKPPPLDEDMRRRLAAHYESQIDQLAVLLDRDLSDWISS